MTIWKILIGVVSPKNDAPASTELEMSRAINGATVGFSRDDALRAFAGVKRKDRRGHRDDADEGYPTSPYGEDQG